MELLQSLDDILISGKSISESGAIKICVDICQALELLAKSGTIHRDIKPSNIFLSKHGDYKLGDFGIARHIERTQSGLSLRGTFDYMAPEAFNRQEYGTSVDLYSIGLVMHRILNSNRMPFMPTHTTTINPDDRENAFNRRMRGETIPPPAHASPELASVILKACAFDRKDRYGNASEMKRALESCMAAHSGEPVTDTPMTRDEPVKPRTYTYDETVPADATPKHPDPAYENPTKVPLKNTKAKKGLIFGLSAIRFGWTATR
jgi:serine/threonine-protein kinase